MKKLNFLLGLIVAAFMAVGCSSSPKVMNVTDLMASAEQYVGQSVVVEGVCNHVCSHGGLKMFIKDEGSKDIFRVQSSDATGAFDKSLAKSAVLVKGVVSESRVDEKYLQEWEAEIAKAAEEAAKAAEAKAENGEEAHEGCGAETQARGETANTVEGRIADFRKKIAERKAESGKDYLSFYHIDATEYELKK